jgi:hypothetical protein
MSLNVVIKNLRKSRAVLFRYVFFDLNRPQRRATQVLSQRLSKTYKQKNVCKYCPPPTNGQIPNNLDAYVSRWSFITNLNEDNY